MQILNFKFKADYKGKPVSEYNDKTILLDKHSAITPKVQIGESWDCQFLFEKDTFAVFKPIKKTADASPEDTKVQQEEITVEDFYKEEYEPSKYQQAIYDEIINGNGNLMVNAVAGSGKTSTLIGALRRISKSKTVKFLAFNRAIVAELRKKVPSTLVNVDISTVHGFGMKALNMKFRNIEVNTRKYIEIAKTISSNWEIKKGVNRDEYISRVIKLCDLGRLNLCKKKKELEELAIKHNIEIMSNEYDKAVELIRIGYKNTKIIDYTDMVYFPVMMNLIVKTHDIVFCDESQDLNACQRELMLKAIKPGGKFCGVGDPSQCQPAGTKILMSGGYEKNIEDINIGDRIISYNTGRTRGGCFSGSIFNSRYGRKVEEIKSRDYNENLIIIRSGKISKYTPNHKCMVKFDNLNDKSLFAVYLMKKENKFRIGVSTLHRHHSFGITARLTKEKADCYWIIKIYDNKKDAIFYEKLYSVKYSIPQMLFVTKDKRKYSFTMSQHDINEFYGKFGSNELFLNAKNMLYKFGMNIDLPFHIRNNHHTHGGRNIHFVIYAIHLKILEKYLLVAHFDESNFTFKDSKKLDRVYKPVWKKINDVYIEKYVGRVYSLKIEKNKNYIADNILTSNSIYGFAGADIKSYQKLLNISNTLEMPLSVCYRCDEKIVKLAQTLVPQIEARNGAPKGVVNKNAKLLDICDSDLVLCRNTFPLVRLCISYLAQGIKAHIMGKDIGTNLINMIRNTRETFISDVFNKLRKELKKIESNICLKRDMSPNEARDTMTYQSYKEKIDVIEVLSKELEKSYEVIGKIEKIFSDDDTEGIILSTIHKAKGLEKNRVFILCPELMPSKWAKQEWEKDQEKNLQYVSITRARHYLGYVTDFDPYDNKKING